MHIYIFFFIAFPSILKKIHKNQRQLHHHHTSSRCSKFFSFIHSWSQTQTKLMESKWKAKKWYLKCIADSYFFIYVFHTATIQQCNDYESRRKKSNSHHIVIIIVIITMVIVLVHFIVKIILPIVQYVYIYFLYDKKHEMNAGSREGKVECKQKHCQYFFWFFISCFVFHFLILFRQRFTVSIQLYWGFDELHGS